MTTTAPTPDSPADRLRVVRRADRESMWFLGDLVQLIITGEMTEGRLMVAYHHSRPASQPPLHEHDAEDEIFYLLEGEITFWSAGREEVLGAGDSIVLPRDVPHTFQVSPDAEARWLVFLTPGGFESFFREVGVPNEYDGPQLDWTSDEDTERRLHAAAERAGITILAPAGTRTLPGSAPEPGTAVAP